MTDPAPASRGTRRGRPGDGTSDRRRGRHAVLAGGGLVAFLLIVVAIGIGYGLIQFAGIQRHDVALADDVDAGGPANWLIVGSDSRASIQEGDEGAGAFLNGDVDHTSQRADTIIIVRVDPQKRELDLLSLPRDLWVERADGHTNRINTAYAVEDGRQVLIDTITAELGIDIHHFVEIDFQAFQDLVGALDGVPLWFDARMRDEHSGLFIPHEGCYTLTGRDALAFARARHLQVSNGVDWVPDPTGDLGRITRQQVFLEHAFTRARDKATSLDGPLAIKNMIDAATRNVGIDSELTLDDLLRLSQRFAEAKDDALHIHTLPVEEFTTGGGASVVRVIPGQAQSVLRVFGGGIDTAPKPEDVDLVVLNGTGTPGQATLVADAYEAIGFDVGAVGDDDADEPLARTEVRYGEGARAQADLVMRHLTARGELVPDDSLRAGRVTLVTGTDFTTVQRIPHPKDPADDAATTTTTVPPTTWGVKPGEAPEGSRCG